MKLAASDTGVKCVGGADERPARGGSHDAIASVLERI